MLWFKNDYGFGAHPKVLAALRRANSEPHDGYGVDECCWKAAERIQNLADNKILFTHFLEGGTQANAVVTDALLRPWQSVISADTGHVNVHETGAIEHTGHKVEPLPGSDFKLTAELVRAKAAAWRDNPIREHVPEPKLVYISQPTEMGTIYRRRELRALRRVCDEFGLYLYIDGARLAYALGSPECKSTLADLVRAADVLTIGGTKCGALFGEAVVFTRRELQENFRASMKQNGALAAKGWVLGLEFSALFKDGLYQKLGAEAVRLAMEIRDAFAAAGVAFASKSPTNQQFVILSEGEAAFFRERGVVYEDCGEAPGGKRVLRFCTSWATTKEDVAELKGLIGQMHGKEP